MSKPTSILVVGPDRALPEEVRAAGSGLSGQPPVIHHVSDYRTSIEIARSRQPDVALVEMTGELTALRLFVAEVAVRSPNTAVAALFYPSVFSRDVAESSLLIDALRSGVQDFLRRPLSSGDLEQFLDRVRRKSSGRAAANGSIISLVSNKGGVGKSTLAVNTGVMLAQQYPGDVLLVDASLQMGVDASLLNLRPTNTLTDAIRERTRLDERLLRELATPHESGLHLLSAPASAVEASEVDDESISLVLTMARRCYDFVIVDTPAVMDRVSMAVLDLSDTVYLVTESVVPTLRGCGQMIELLTELGLGRERTRVVLNKYSSFVGNLRPDDAVVRIGAPIDHVVPYQKKVLVAANLGRPFVLDRQDWFGGYTKAVGRIAQEIAVRPRSYRAETEGAEA